MLSQLNKLPARTDYVEAVYKTLLDAISDGSLPPGTRITQEEIAEQNECVSLASLAGTPHA